MKKKLSMYSFVFIIALSCFNLVQSSPKFYTNNNYSNPIDVEAILSPVVTQAFNELNIPGAIVGVKIGDSSNWVTALGVGDLLTKEPIETDDKMRIGSITKTFTGTVLLQLIDEGKIGLNDKLSKYFPDYPNSDNISIEQLANMTSGLFNYSDDEVWADSMLADLQKSFTPADLIEKSKRHDPLFPPGEKFSYSNTNTIILGVIIEKVTGSSLQSEIQKRVLDPLGMTSTNFAMDATFPGPHPKGYFYMDSTDANPADVTDLNPSWGWAAGSIISTVGDLLNYAKPLATGKLVSKNSQDVRLKWSAPMYPHADAWKEKEIKYGFAICSFDGAIGHNGGIPGFNSFMGYLPEKDATIIVLVNMQTTKSSISPADFIAMKIIEKLKSL